MVEPFQGKRIRVNASEGNAFGTFTGVDRPVLDRRGLSHPGKYETAWDALFMSFLHFVLIWVPIRTVAWIVVGFASDFRVNQTENVCVSSATSFSPFVLVGVTH